MEKSRNNRLGICQSSLTVTAGSRTWLVRRRNRQTVQGQAKEGAESGRSEE